MTERDDIIRMAREAGFNTDHDLICIEGWEISPYMQRFAKLVAAEKDKQIAFLKDSHDAIRELAYKTGAAEEREACAQIAARWDDDVETRTKPSDAIRARGESNG